MGVANAGALSQPPIFDGSGDGPVSVGVLVDLEFSEYAGGHVKCWQRFAEAALRRTDLLDLTIYFLGEQDQRIELGSNVRYRLLPARFGTRRLRFLAQGAGHTDLALFHPRLAQELPRHDLLHTTDIFAFARTAARVARRFGMPLVASLHTDLPELTAIYTDEIVYRALGRGSLSSFLLDRLRFRAWNVRRVRRDVCTFLRRCDHVMVAHGAEIAALSPLLDVAKVSRLRRGIDKRRFSPSRRDRARLADRFGIARDVPVLLFVGRLDASKHVMLAAGCARELIDRGHPVRFLAIGDGAQKQKVRDLLGRHAVLPGQLPQEEFAWVYASADIFLFPSRSETVGNVVLEAKSSGLPTVVADAPGPAQLIRQPGVDGLVIAGDDTETWVCAVEGLLADRASRRAMSAAARHMIVTGWPSWDDVLMADLLPVWRRLAISARRPSNRRTGY